MLKFPREADHVLQTTGTMGTEFGKFWFAPLIQAAWIVL